MIEAALDRLGRLGRFAWSGWAGLAGLSLLAALWQMGHEAYGDLILPAPLPTLQTAFNLLLDPVNWRVAMQTAIRAVEGFLLASLIGGVLGLLAGYSAGTLRIARPLLTVILGVPPIAWIVLAMIWFGSTDGTVVMTVLVAASPVVFANVAEGVATRNRGLDDMAKAFGANAIQRLTSIGARQVADHFSPRSQLRWERRSRSRSWPSCWPMSTASAMRWPSRGRHSTSRWHSPGF